MILSSQAAFLPGDTSAILEVVARYQEARTISDEAEIARLFTDDADQLVSSGNWRFGRAALVKGMLASSKNNPGRRELIVEKVRFLDEEIALADARYTIYRKDGTARKMWSTFILQKVATDWKISAIRNMYPRE